MASGARHSDNLVKLEGFKIFLNFMGSPSLLKLAKKWAKVTKILRILEGVLLIFLFSRGPPENLIYGGPTPSKLPKTCVICTSFCLSEPKMNVKNVISESDYLMYIPSFSAIGRP